MFAFCSPVGYLVQPLEYGPHFEDHYSVTVLNYPKSLKTLVLSVSSNIMNYFLGFSIANIVST